MNTLNNPLCRNSQLVYELKFGHFNKKKLCKKNFETQKSPVNQQTESFNLCLK